LSASITFADSVIAGSFLVEAIKVASTLFCMSMQSLQGSSTFHASRAYICNECVFTSSGGGIMQYHTTAL